MCNCPDDQGPAWKRSDVLLEVRSTGGGRYSCLSVAAHYFTTIRFVQQIHDNRRALRNPSKILNLEVAPQTRIVGDDAYVCLSICGSPAE